MPSGPVVWEVHRRAPDARLGAGVLSYTGYAERADVPMRRLEVPSASIPMIISLGPSLLVDGVRHHSFVGGLNDAVTVTQYEGEQRGLQVNLTPLAARQLLGVPMIELTRQVVALEDVLGATAAQLITRLQEAPNWQRRFALLDDLLLARVEQAPLIAPEVEHVWTQLQAADGAVSIAALSEQVGWSRRHLAARFREDVGLPPKAVARILRFGHVTRTLRTASGGGLADIAYACGYADQAHLNRDFRAFAGTTPTGYVARLLPDGAGVAADVVPNVQDTLSCAV